MTRRSKPKDGLCFPGIVFTENTSFKNERLQDPTKGMGFILSPQRKDFGQKVAMQGINSWVLLIQNSKKKRKQDTRTVKNTLLH